MKEVVCSECAGEGRVAWTTTRGCGWLSLAALLAAGGSYVAYLRFPGSTVTDDLLVWSAVVSATVVLFWVTGRVRIQCPICMGRGMRPVAEAGQSVASASEEQE